MRDCVDWDDYHCRTEYNRETAFKEWYKPFLLGLIVTAIAFPLAVGLHHHAPFYVNEWLDAVSVESPEGKGFLAHVWAYGVVIFVLLVNHVLLLAFSILEAGLVGAGVCFAYGYLDRVVKDRAYDGYLDRGGDGRARFVFYSAWGGGALLFWLHEYNWWSSSGPNRYARYAELLSAQAFYLWWPALLSIPGHVYGGARSLARVISNGQWAKRQRKNFKEMEEQHEKWQQQEEEKKRQEQEAHRLRQQQLSREREEQERQQRIQQEAERRRRLEIQQKLSRKREKRQQLIGEHADARKRLKIHQHFPASRFRSDNYEFLAFTQLTSDEAAPLGLKPVFTKKTALIDWKVQFRRECRKVFNHVPKKLAKMFPYSAEEFEHDLDQIAGEHVQLYQTDDPSDANFIARSKHLLDDFQSLIQTLEGVAMLQAYYRFSVKEYGDLITSDLPPSVFNQRIATILEMDRGGVALETKQVSDLINSLTESLRRKKKEQEEADKRAAEVKREQKRRQQLFENMVAEIKSLHLDAADERVEIARARRRAGV